MKYLGPLLCLIALPTFVFAQSNYKAGYVVNTQGDTVKGFIDVKEWDFNPETINFKPTVSDDHVTKLGPGDISYFEATGFVAYKSYSGRITNDSTDPDKLVGDDAVIDTSTRFATVFLKVLEGRIGNKVALYSFKDENKMRYFIGASPDFTMQELIFRMSKTNAENTFRKQLSAAALKFNELDDNTITRIARTEYNDDDILSVVNKINHISADTYKIKHYTGSPYNFSIGMGVNINNTSPSSVGAFYGAGGRASTSYKPAVFAGINLFPNPATRRLQFRVELSASQSSYKSLYDSKYYPYVPTEASYDKLAFSISPIIIYNFYNSDKLRIFSGAGISFTHYSFSNSYLGAQNRNSPELDITATNHYYFNTTDNTFLLRLGVQFGKHFAVFGDYQSNVLDTEEGYFDLSSTCEHIGVIYMFE
jgi:hypothetical protein